MAKKTRLGLALCLLLVSMQTSVIFTSAQNEYTYTRRTNPDRTIVAYSSGRWLATFT